MGRARHAGVPERTSTGCATTVRARRDTAGAGGAAPRAPADAGERARQPRPAGRAVRRSRSGRSRPPSAAAPAARGRGRRRRARGARAHRRAGPGHQHARRHADARGPAGLSAGEGRERAGAPGEPGPRDALRAAVRAHRAAPAPYPTHLATYTSARSRLHARERGGTEACRSAGRDGRASRSPRPSPSGAASTPSASTTRCTTVGATPWEARALRADPAQRSAHQELLLQRRELRVPRAGDPRRHQVPQARHHRRRGRHLSLEVRRRLDRGPAASLRERRSCRRAGRRGTSPLGVSAATSTCSPPPGRSRASRPGASATFTQTLFVGPKLQAQLDATAPELERVADYGGCGSSRARCSGCSTRCTRSSATGASRSSSSRSC